MDDGTSDFDAVLAFGRSKITGAGALLQVV
jgi:hypothetical protein